ncbi:hypothetical protein QYM36_018539 [Artemia franciscana]|uniref:Uncharacterized protein n=1 Tax=Artemia franciscana TaxID=6661 RepID=A0AA88KRG0_ARTSF|nr:hypothetical protein QYM36_018539 [Artemia franciscana]
MDSGLVPLVDLGPVQYQNVRSPSGYMNCTANQHQLPVDESRSEHVQAGQTQLYYNTVVRAVGEMDIPEKELNSECVIFTPVEEDQTFPNDMILLRILKGVVTKEDLEFVCNKERKKLSVHMKKSETKGKLLATTKLGKIDVMCQERKRHSRGVIKGIDKEYSVEDIKAEIVSEAKTMVPVEKAEQMKKDAVQTALEAVTAALVIKPDLINITNLTVDQSVLKICTALEFIMGVKPDATKIAAGIARSNSIGSNSQGVTTSEK